MWQIEFSAKARKQFKKLPNAIKEQATLLIEELNVSRPIRGNWLNFSKLSKNEYHCHLKKGRPTYVICWRVEDKKLKIIEVYYVGTHEKAPY